MGSCAAKNKSGVTNRKVLRPTAIIIHDWQKENDFKDPKIRHMIFLQKDSKAPILHLELNQLRNKRFSQISSNLPTDI
jgi:hypothetical protein